jgi:hypothetical protein
MYGYMIAQSTTSPPPSSPHPNQATNININNIMISLGKEKKRNTNEGVAGEIRIKPEIFLSFFHHSALSALGSLYFFSTKAFTRESNKKMKRKRKSIFA